MKQIEKNLRRSACFLIGHDWSEPYLVSETETTVHYDRKCHTCGKEIIARAGAWSGDFPNVVEYKKIRLKKAKSQIKISASSLLIYLVLICFIAQLSWGLFSIYEIEGLNDLYAGAFLIFAAIWSIKSVRRSARSLLHWLRISASLKREGGNVD